MCDARPDLLQVFRHRKGKDYHELFTAVAKETSPKLFMALAARFGWHSGTLYRCLFLNVLIKISTSSCLTKKHGMCGRLLRTIYGLKQCGREWFLLLTSFLKIWFKLLCVDHSVFYNGHLSILAYGAMWPRIKRLVHMEWEDPWHFVSLAYIKAMQAMTNITVKHLRFICVVIHWELYLYLEPSVIYSKRTLQESCPTTAWQ